MSKNNKQTLPNIKIKLKSLDDFWDDNVNSSCVQKLPVTSLNECHTCYNIFWENDVRNVRERYHPLQLRVEHCFCTISALRNEPSTSQTESHKAK